MIFQPLQWWYQQKTDINYYLDFKQLPNENFICGSANAVISIIIQIYVLTIINKLI